MTPLYIFLAKARHAEAQWFPDDIDGVDFPTTWADAITAWRTAQANDIGATWHHRVIRLNKDGTWDDVTSALDQAVWDDDREAEKQAREDDDHERWEGSKL